MANFRRAKRTRFSCEAALAIGSLLMATGCDPVVTGADEADAGDGPDEGTPRWLEARDVSLLFPLPTSASSGDLLRMNDAGPRGVLFERTHHDSFATLASTDLDQYANLRVVAARFDPCSVNCLPELRLIVQRISNGAANDGSFHLFFSLESTALAPLTADLRRLALLAPDLPSTGSLGPHPIMAAEGLSGPYATMAKEIILRYAGDDNLVRITQTLRKFGKDWDFVAFNRSGEEFVQQVIPRYESDELQELHDESTSTVRRLRIVPSISPNDANISLLVDSSRWASATEEAWASAIAESFKQDNPNLTPPPDMDCASCHVASRVRKAALAFRPAAVDNMVERFLTDSPLESGDQGGDRADAVLSFAYLGQLPMISERTLNDSIQSAERFEAVH
jgi:hypothetical protein